ncbi:hypothetical protein GTY65_19860 [Streptomyces sp. SID8379]|uniref:DUF6907 domain-containing protein n=1 Tax=unclassified Streptomyces TaxID=2593676 RepID=UPI0003736BC6|nr:MULTISPECIES: hypothetical protein [unclassified Streptomyces]MYW66291.1 hypothetical protein [Streptomyces sp. SID8379]
MTAIVQTPPATRPGFKLVPATIGSPTKGQALVYVECPNWCTEDHADEWQHSVDDVSHWGDYFGASIPSFTQDDAALDLSARVFADPYSADARMRGAHVLVETAAGDRHLTSQMADEIADDLIKLAGKIREAARVASQANGDSDPDMDEALRRVRQGGVA